MIFRIVAGHPLARWPLAAALAGLLAFVIARVDLAPAVDGNFFFSTGDPALRQEERIAEVFPARTPVYVSASGDRASPAYTRDVSRLTRAIDAVPGVENVQSMTRGPESVAEAYESPFWRRLLVGEDGRSTLLIATLSRTAEADGPAREAAVGGIEAAADGLRRSGFEIGISGGPFVVERIRTHVLEDMITFTSAALAVFGAILFALFRSAGVVAGMFAACLFASAGTLLGAHAAGIRIGVLTANLVTLVFIMTLQHTVYLAYNLRHAVAEGGARREAVRAAVRMTGPASFWGMVTTMAGFASLLLVDAKPLRELGASGSIGAVLAFVSAYLAFPSFLHHDIQVGDSGRRSSTVFFARPRVAAALALVAAAAVAAPGAFHLKTEPSFTSYFAEGSEIREGLELVDRNGGSIPLFLVVRDASGGRLDTRKAYPRLWNLQREIEAHPSVGGALSLPVLLAEAKESVRPFSFLFSNRVLVDRMESPEYGRIADAFVTRDRTRAMVMLRMKENGGEKRRLEEIDEIRSIVRHNGFRAQYVGGLYHLQGRFSDLIHRSLLTGIVQLVAFFLVVAAFVSRSVRWTLALGATLCLPAAIVLGGFGLLAVPVDLGSAPAVNIAVAMGIADMIQLTVAARRRRRDGAAPWEAWRTSLERLWRPAAGTSLAVSAGFAIFLLSNFPPTQRFGLAVVAGTVFALYGSLVALPALAAAPVRGPSPLAPTAPIQSLR